MAVKLKNVKLVGMKVKEAKEIISTMELSNKALDQTSELLAGMADEDELPDKVLDQLLALIDKETVDTGDDEISDEEVLKYVDKQSPVVKK